MAVREMLTLMISSTLLFTAIGGAIGFSLGQYFPSYYRMVCRNGQSADFDPLAMGLGLGLTQGITAGGIVGFLLVVVLAWYRLKTFVPQTIVR